MKSAPDVALFSRSFRFLDVEFEVCSDTKPVVDLFGAALPLLEQSSLDGDPLRFVIQTKRGSLDKPTITFEDRSFAVHNSDLLVGIAYMRVMQEVYRRVESHILIHGAAVSKDGMGLIFPASSSSGKTTLAARLVMEGWDFLSDDLAAVDPGTGSMAPLPRSLGIRGGTRAMLGMENLKEIGRLPYISGGEKMLFDVESIRPGCIPSSARMSRLVLLNSSNGELLSSPIGSTLFLSADRPDGAFVDSLCALPGVESVDVKEGAFVELEIRHNRSGLFSEIESLADEKDVMIFERGGSEAPAIRFDGRPSMERINTIDASRELARNFLGGSRSRLLATRFNGSAASMIFELTGLLEEVECYRILTGDLEEMVRLLYTVI